MVTIGVDLHKRTHTLVVVDQAGRQLATRTVPATVAGHLETLKWALGWAERSWALEDCRHLSRRFEADLVRAGEAVVRVPPKMMAGVRRAARTRGKSDPIDALAVAQAALREPNLPTAQLDGVAREIQLLLDHRDALVAERTRHQNRLRWHLHELDPGNEPAPRSLSRAHVLLALETQLAPLSDVVARLACDLVARCRSLTAQIKELDAEIKVRATALAPTLLALQVAAWSPPPSSLARRPAFVASAPAPPSRCTTAPHRSQSGRATSAIGSTEVATARSTPPCTGSPSRRCGIPVLDATTSCVDERPATPSWRRFALSSDGSPTRSTAASGRTSSASRPLSPITRPPLDIGGTRHRGPSPLAGEEGPPGARRGGRSEDLRGERPTQSPTPARDRTSSPARGEGYPRPTGGAPAARRSRSPPPRPAC